MSLEKEFVPYELAVKLKELGYPQDNIGLGYVLGDYYNTEGDFNGCCIKVIKDRTNKLTKATLWQQAFDFFREKGYECTINRSIPIQINLGFKKYYCYIWNENSNPRGCGMEKNQTFDTYEEARFACIKKLIEIISK